MTIALGRLGRMEEAKAAVRSMLEIAPDFTVSRYLSVSPFKDAEFRKQGGEVLRAAGVPE